MPSLSLDVWMIREARAVVAGDHEEGVAHPGPARKLADEPIQLPGNLAHRPQIGGLLHLLINLANSAPARTDYGGFVYLHDHGLKVEGTGSPRLGLDDQFTGQLAGGWHRLVPPVLGSFDSGHPVPEDDAIDVVIEALIEVERRVETGIGRYSHGRIAVQAQNLRQGDEAIAECVPSEVVATQGARVPRGLQ